MKIAVLEYFTSLSPGARAADLAVEGRAIRDAVVADLARVPGAEVIVVERRSVFGAALRSADAALVVAPEERGILERLCRLVERRGRLLLGPSSAAARLLGDKLLTGRVLAAAGVPTPDTWAVPWVSARRRLCKMSPPFVLKPRDGCGSRGVVVVRRAREIDEALATVRRATRQKEFLVQEYVPGRPGSVSLIVSTNRLTLGLNRQRLHRGRTFAYLGGETFWPHPRSGEAVVAARAAVEALARSCGGVRGYVGVDLVIGRAGVTVIEVNPRLTTSYVGLRLSVRDNLAALIVDAARGRVLPERVTPAGRCRFGTDGATTMLTTVAVARPREATAFARGGEGEGRKGWRTISAGTSAASI